MHWSTTRVLYCYRDIKILIKTNINFKHCPGLEFRVIPEFISWAGSKSNISEFVVYSDCISAIWSQCNIVPVTQEKFIQTEKGTRGKKNLLWRNIGSSWKGHPKVHHQHIIVSGKENFISFETQVLDSA